MVTRSHTTRAIHMHTRATIIQVFPLITTERLTGGDLEMNGFSDGFCEPWQM